MDTKKTLVIWRSISLDFLFNMGDFNVDLTVPLSSSRDGFLLSSDIAVTSVETSEDMSMILSFCPFRRDSQSTSNCRHYHPGPS